MDIQTLRSLYAKGIITPEDVVEEVYKRLQLPTADSAVWLHVFPKNDVVARARKLLKENPDPTMRHPLFGIPFSIKDSIDIQGVLTTAACPAYAYTAEKDAPSYATLIDAGCIAIGKVNLVRHLFCRGLHSKFISYSKDQLATGLFLFVRVAVKSNYSASQV
jgi:Asp-tRNA(Asn)/Glu-tRNA(Gln) amidotransferase A subunit family amidase